VKYYNEVKGFNSRLDPLQAAFLRVKLKHLDEWNKHRARIADYYCETLAGMTSLVLPWVPEGIRPAWHLFVIRYPQREDLQKYLTQAEVGTLIHYPIPPHLSGAYADLGYHLNSYPVTEDLARTVLSLPMGPHLSSRDAGKVIKAIQTFIS
jgi:dTDP-4-amino-4,6-dideoxygalactose transaminase